ncbi:MAG: hypothetical protein OXC15_00545 [Rhodospirillaceae bacterium]|nr:hypothetical protein [Rhodospirillaceae bacterium]
MNKQTIDVLHGRLTALEALMFMVPSYRGPHALHRAIEGIDKRPAETPADARELAALKMRLESVLASLERDGAET